MVRAILLGDKGVGKTSLLNSLGGKESIESSTEVVQFDARVPPPPGGRYDTEEMIFAAASPASATVARFEITGTADQERYRTITSSYYRGANCAIVCYAIDRAGSFAALEVWMTDVERYASSEAAVVICGLGGRSKGADGGALQETLAVSRDRGLEFAARHQAAFVEIWWNDSPEKMVEDLVSAIVWGTNPMRYTSASASTSSAADAAAASGSDCVAASDASPNGSCATHKVYCGGLYQSNRRLLFPNQSACAPMPLTSSSSARGSSSASSLSDGPLKKQGACSRMIAAVTCFCCCCRCSTECLERSPRAHAHGSAKRQASRSVVELSATGGSYHIKRVCNDDYAVVRGGSSAGSATGSAYSSDAGSGVGGSGVRSPSQLQQQRTDAKQRDGATLSI
jgi:GTPase SAR1 family protein